MIVEKMLELVNQKSTLCIGGEGSSIRKICCLKGKIQKKTIPLLYLGKNERKKSIHFSNCREKKQNISGVLFSFEEKPHKLHSYTML